MPPYRIVSQTKDGKFVYTFADPENCHCLYVGGPNEYSEYQRQHLTVERGITQDLAAESMDSSRWGPWSW